MRGSNVAEKTRALSSYASTRGCVLRERELRKPGRTAVPVTYRYASKTGPRDTQLRNRMQQAAAPKAAPLSRDW